MMQTNKFPLFIIPAIFLMGSRVHAQLTVSPDTSFTVYSTYVKESKKRPYISIAKPLMPKNVKAYTNVVFASVGDRKLLADVYYPARKRTSGYPGIIMVFGGGWKSGDRSQNIPLAQQLAAKGYVAVTMDYRLSGEAKYPAALHDVKGAIRWLRANAKRYNVDTTKIATLGMSAGGQLAALAGATNEMSKFEGNVGNSNFSSEVQAIVDIDGILAFHHPESAEGTVAAEWLGGTFVEKPQLWTEASALTHAGKNTPPMLFINSSTPRFHAGRDDLIAVLDQYGIYHEEHTFNDTPHPFWFFHPWFTPTVKLIVNFLDKVFKEKL